MVAHLKKLPAFMELKGPSLCPQELATGPYLQPDKSSPHCLILFKINFHTDQNIWEDIPYIWILAAREN
jgi:hypothetical protein